MYLKKVASKNRVTGRALTLAVLRRAVGTVAAQVEAVDGFAAPGKPMDARQIMTKKTHRKKTRSRLRLHAGFRYLRQDGQETGEIRMTHWRQYPYFDPIHQKAYLEDGTVWYGTDRSPENLVAEILIQAATQYRLEAALKNAKAHLSATQKEVIQWRERIDALMLEITNNQTESGVQK